ncbi:MAG: 2TM domain-containing protein [Flavobacteriaceae bacterium]|nr:2TM domain-containing protein [Flavobacteriaceae bacterium]
MEKYSEASRYNRAKKKVDKIKGFYTHAIVYVVINTMLLSMIYTGYANVTDFWNFGSFSTAIGWGIGLFVHGISVFGKQLFFSSNWEEKKMEQFLKEEEQNNHKWE